MIPWDTLKQNQQSPDWAADLHEQNLYYYITKGPTQLKRGLDSPMLELAHERQFAISQLGTQSVGFEAQHSARVRDALQLMERRFTAHHVEELCRPSSPHAADVIDLRTQSHRFTPLPALDLSDPAPPISHTNPPVMAIERPARSSLPLKDLMNPTPPPSSSRKRRASNDFMPGLLANDELDAVLYTQNDLSLDHTLGMKYSRASQFRGDGAPTRTRRCIRMRARSLARHKSLEA